jgi:hypothetical protein
VTQLSRLAFIGNSLPRRCGIATFTTDLQQAISTSFAHVETSIVAMNDHGHAYDYPSVVRLQVNDDRIEDYVHAADVLNAAGCLCPACVESQHKAVSQLHELRSSRRRWAASLFSEALPAAESFRWPRAWAFTLLALLRALHA